MEWVNLVEWLARIAGWVLAAVAVVGFFGLTVFVHELGHFLAARLFGMVVETFSIGFGPAIWSWRRQGTVYKIGWIPLGGYVSLPQLDPAAMSTVQGKDPPAASASSAEDAATVEDAATAPRLPPALWWQRILVSLAGPFGNIVLALAIAGLISWLPPVGIAPGLDLDGAVIGSVTADSPAERAGLRVADEVLEVAGVRVGTWGDFMTECHLASGGEVRTVSLSVSNRIDALVRTVEAPLSAEGTAGFYRVPNIGPLLLCALGEVLPGHPAEAAGLMAGDLIVSADGRPVYGAAQFIATVQGGGGEPLELGILRGASRLTVSVTPGYASESGRWLIGAVVVDADPGVPVWMQYRRPLRQLRGDLSAIGRVLQALVAPRRKGESGRVAQALSGPIVILATLWMHTLVNLVYTIGFVRFLNVNLAVINLLPLPVLDGGHILFALYEGITRRKVPPKVLNVLVNAFAILLLALFVLISVRDTWVLRRLFGRAGREETEELQPATPGDRPGEPAPVIPPLEVRP